MKKFAKISLVAALAVAGTAASAQPLAEAIENVDVSGTVVYRYDDSQTKTDGGTETSKNSNKYKIGLNVKSKVNDDVAAVTRFIIGGADNGFIGLKPQEGGDGQASVALSQAYFSYTGLANTTINVGKQGLTTPWTVAIDSDGNEQTGTGILALSNIGPVTLAAAYFNQNNTTFGLNDIATLGVMANVGPVALDAWYLNLSTNAQTIITGTDAAGNNTTADINEGLDTYTLGAKANFDLDVVNLGAKLRYTALDSDVVGVPAGDIPDNNMLHLTLTAKAGIVSGKFVYAMTDKEGGIIALDDDAKTNVKAWNVTPFAKADADFYNFVVGVQVLPSLNLSANYAQVKYQDNINDAQSPKDTQEEIYAQAKYNMSKNLSTYVRFGTQEDKTNDVKASTDYKGRLQVQYSF